MTISKIQRISFAFMVFMVSLFNYSEVSALKTAANMSVILFIGIILFTAEEAVKIPESFKYIAVFFTFCLLSCLISTAQNDSLSKIKTLIILIPMFLAIYLYIDTKEELDKVLLILSSATIVTSIYIITQGAGALDTVRRVSNVTGDSNQVSTYLVYGIILLIYMLVYRKMPKIIALSGIITSVLAIILQGSRSAIVCAGLIIILETLLLMRYNRTPLTKKLIFLLILTGFLTAVVYFIMTDPILYMTLGRRLISFYEIQTGQGSSINEHSTSSRLMAYQLAFERFLNSPVLGNGIGSFAEYSLSTTLNRRGFCPNNYLELLQGIGVIGTLSYYAVYISILKDSISYVKKHIDPIYIVSICMIMAMLIEHITVVFYYHKLEYIYLGMLLAAVAIEYRKEQKDAD